MHGYSISLQSQRSKVLALLLTSIQHVQNEKEINANREPLFAAVPLVHGLLPSQHDGDVEGTEFAP